MNKIMTKELKKFNRDLLKKRLSAAKKKQKIERVVISEEDIFNLDVALKACDSFEDLYEIIEIL